MSTTLWRNTSAGKAYMKTWWAKHKDEVNAGQRARYKRDPQKEHHRNLKRRFNLSPEEYAALVTAQNGVCAICTQADTRRLSVDHCHITGKVRGLLCKKCNQFLWALDEPGWLAKAQCYLTKGVQD